MFNVEVSNIQHSTYDNRHPAMRYLLALLVFTACSGGAIDSGVVVRDSAGITIVENSDQSWAEGEGWRLSEQPLVTIGVLEGPEEYQLFEAYSAVRLGDGRIVIANGGSREMRFYDEDGTFINSVGREGEGPGEFKMLRDIWPARGDSLVVYDYTNGMRLSVFGSDGTFARAFRLDPASTSIPLARDLIWGNTVVSGSGIYESDEVTDGLRRDSALICTHSMDGAVLDTLGRFPGSEMYARITGANSMLGLSRPYGRRAVATAAGEFWYFGSSDRYEIEGYGSSGALERLIRRDVPNRPVTQDLIDERTQRLRESSNPNAARMQRDIPMPETMPAYGRMIGDSEGNLWVQEYRIRDEPERWAVFDPSGRFLGIVDMPASGRVTEIGSDYVLGIWTDEMDVEQVRVYDLTKTSKDE
jgi:hypothetical protein